MAVKKSLNVYSVMLIVSTIMLTFANLVLILEWYRSS